MDTIIALIHVKDENKLKCFWFIYQKIYIKKGIIICTIKLVSKVCYTLISFSFPILFSADVFYIL